MALRLFGKDPGSGVDDSPTLYYDEDRETDVLRSWKVTDADRLAQLSVSEYETVIEFPRRMMRFLLEVSGGDGAHG